MRRKNVFSMDVLCLQHFCLFIDHPERLLSTWSGGEPSFINGVKFYAFSSTTSFYLFYFWYYYFYFFSTRIFLEFQNPYRNLSIHVAEGNNILKTNLHFMRVLTTAGTSCLQILMKMTASLVVYRSYASQRSISRKYAHIKVIGEKKNIDKFGNAAWKIQSILLVFGRGHNENIYFFYWACMRLQSSGPFSKRTFT